MGVGSFIFNYICNPSLLNCCCEKTKRFELILFILNFISFINSKAGPMHPLILALCVFFFILFQSSAQPDGWKMTDRFYGFRYELQGENIDKQQVLESIQNEADNFACFGWAQETPHGSIAGEARCSKARGKVFQEKLQMISEQISKVDILVIKFFTNVVYNMTKY
jgi:hypothetical protein